jgi:hypothetical protein
MAASDAEHIWISAPDLVLALRAAAEARGSTVGALGRDIIIAWARGEAVREPREEMRELRRRESRRRAVI